jgi:peptidoglycan/LPS O-acetylase OafA/YrhL
MGHYFMVEFPFSREGGSRYLAALLRSSPWAGVWIFFTLSGYLMGKGFARGRYTLNEEGSRLFLRNRILRIAPVYYLGLVFVSIYRYPEIFQWRHWWMLLEIFIFDFRGDLPINSIGALWSVSTEVQFYLLVPLLMVALLHLSKFAGKAFPLVPLFLVCAATAGRMHIAATPSNMYTYGYAPLIPNLDLFIAGMSLNLFPKLEIRPDLRAWIGPLLVAATGGFYVAICGLPGELHMSMQDFWAKGPALCVLFAAAFIYLAETHGKIAIARNVIGLCLSGIQWIGTLTYCLYVFHPDVFVSNAALLPAHHSLQLSLQYFPLVILETLAVAMFFYFAVEKPFDLKKRVSGTALVDAP